MKFREQVDPWVEMALSWKVVEVGERGGIQVMSTSFAQG
jgi:hypothetical protein